MYMYIYIREARENSIFYHFSIYKLYLDEVIQA